MKLLKTTALGAILGSLAMVSFSAGAATISFDDDEATQDGTLYYGGGGGALTGSGIDFVSMIGVDTPFDIIGGGSAIACENCELNFTTGNNIQEGPALWTFAGGGSFTITGGISALGIAAGSTLVSGSFDSVAVIGDGANNGALVVNGIGTDTKHERIVRNYFQTLDAIPFEFAQTEISIGNVFYADCPEIAVSTPSECGGFRAEVNNADFDNMAVPVPAAVWLFGSGLLGLVGIARRRRA